MRNCQQHCLSEPYLVQFFSLNEVAFFTEQNFNDSPKVEDGPDDAFIASLEDFTLDTWDHRTHLRIAWLMLTRHDRRWVRAVRSS